MGYVLGISSGLFGVERKDVGLYGLGKKGYYCIRFGVRFTQIDVETITEFADPFLKEEVERLKAFGIEFGFHGETGMTGGTREVVDFDSALKDTYELTHKRLITQIKVAGELGAKYLLFHASENIPIQFLYKHMQPSFLVDFWGRPLRNLIEEEKFLEKFLFESEDEIQMEVWRHVTRYVYPAARLRRYLAEEKSMLQSKKTEEIVRILGANYPEDEREKKIKEVEERFKKQEKELEEMLKEYVKKEFLTFIESNDLSYGPEVFAYIVVAKWMNEKKDPIWRIVVGKKLSDKELLKDIDKWVPAVAIKYIWGHFNPKSEDFEDPKPLLEKYKMYLVWETGCIGRGMEDYLRVGRPIELYTIAKNLGTSYAAWCLDLEHILTSYKMDVVKEIEKLPKDAGSYLKVVHFTYPSPHHAHFPVSLGSEAQELWYKILFTLRQKGFKDGWIIYERGSMPAEQTIEVMRRIKEFLEKDVPPEQLPPEFYGITVDEPEFVRQREIIIQHALDPLKGLISVPEVDHTFLSRFAVERGRLEQWRKEEMR